MEETNKKSNSKKIYNIVSTIIVALIFIFLVIVVAVMIIQKNNTGDTTIFGYYMFDVVTDSMEPTINVDDVILAKKIDDVNELEVGDVITFVAPSGPLQGYNETHRIVSISYNEDGTVAYFRTKGDNPEVEEDNWNLPVENVKAKYVKTSTFIGGLRNFLSTWYGYVILIVIPILIVGVLFIISFIKDKVKLEEEKIKEENAPKLDSLSDDEKKKLLEIYLNESEGNNTEEKSQIDENQATNGIKEE